MRHLCLIEHRQLRLKRPGRLQRQNAKLVMYGEAAATWFIVLACFCCDFAAYEKRACFSKGRMMGSSYLRVAYCTYPAPHPPITGCFGQNVLDYFPEQMSQQACIPAAQKGLGK